MNSARAFKIRTIFALGFTLYLILFFTQASLADDNPPARAARISYLKGKVSFQPAGQDQWSEATLNFTVTTGDRLYTDRGARAELEIGPYTVRLAEQTDLIVTNLYAQGAFQHIPCLVVTAVDMPRRDKTWRSRRTTAITPFGNDKRIVHGTFVHGTKDVASKRRSNDR